MFETIVLALDGSESSDRALTYATQLAKEHESSIRVVHVIEIVAARGGGPMHLNENELRGKVERQVAELADAGFNAELEIHTTMAGGPAHVIADVAQRTKADVIVTGTRGHTALAGILLGSVTQRLLHVAHCPVVVVPHTSRLQAAAGERSMAATVSG